MTLRQLSSLARPVDPSYPTNRAILVIVALVAVGGFTLGILTGGGWLPSIGLGGGSALTVFVAWALCREVDPDRDLSAFVATALALAGTVLWGLPDLAGLFCVLLAIRIVNRTTGLPATVLDSIALLGLATWLTLRGAWWFGATTTVAFLADGILAPILRRHLVFAMASLTVTAVACVSNGGSGIGSQFLFAGATALALCFLFVPMLLASGHLTSVADDTNQALIPKRVRTGQAIALFCGLAASLSSGWTGLFALLPLWSATTGATAYLTVLPIVRKTAGTSA